MREIKFTDISTLPAAPGLRSSWHDLAAARQLPCSPQAARPHRKSLAPGRTDFNGAWIVGYHAGRKCRHRGTTPGHLLLPEDPAVCRDADLDLGPVAKVADERRLKVPVGTVELWPASPGETQVSFRCLGLPTANTDGVPGVQGCLSE